VEGVSDKPKKSLQESGKRAAAKDLAKGAVGVVTKPTVGTIDFVSKVSEGIRNSTLEDRHVTRTRYPRHFTDNGVLLPYNEELARAQYFLKTVKDSRYLSRRFVWAIRCSPKCVLIAATCLVMCVRLRRKDNSVKQVWAADNADILNVGYASSIAVKVTVDANEEKRKGPRERLIPCQSEKMASEVLEAVQRHLTKFLVPFEMKAAVPPEVIEWSTAETDEAYALRHAMQLEQQRKLEESIMQREMEFKKLAEESRQLEEAKLAQQRIKRRETRLHDEAERQARADKAEKEALAQLEETRQTLRRKKSDFDTARRLRKQQREHVLQRIQQVLGEQKLLKHTVESLNRAVQLEEVKTILQIERTDLKADGLDAAPMVPTASAANVAVPPLEVNASMLSDAKSKLERAEEEQKSLQQRLMQLGVSHLSLVRYGLEGKLQPVATDETAEDQKQVEASAGPRLLSIAETLRERRAGGTQTALKAHHPKKQLRVSQLPTLAAWQRHAIEVFLLCLLFLIVVGAIYVGGVVTA